MRVLAIAACLGLLTCGGCTVMNVVFQLGPRVADCGDPVPSTQALAGDFNRRLRVEVQSGDVTEGFEVIAQKRGPRLVVVGLARFGNRAFSIVQERDQLDVESPMKPIERVAPINILRDLYVWPFQAQPAPDGVVLAISSDGRSAELTHEACGFTTTIVDLDAAHE